MNSRIKIWVGNLGKYNEGILVGEWLRLPATTEEIEALKNRIGINAFYEEWFIADYECELDGFTVGEYEDMDYLNEVAEAMANMTEDDMLAFEAMISEGYDFHEAMDKLSSGDYRIYSDCKDMTDVAYEMVEESGMLDNVPEFAARYFDYESFGRDVRLEGYSTFVFMSSGDCVEIMH